MLTNSNNVAVGFSALQESKGASSNVAIGANAMRGTTNTDITGGDNVAMVINEIQYRWEMTILQLENSLGNNTGDYNSSLGSNSLKNDNTDGR